VAEVHPDTIRGWVKAGRLQERRAGRELRVLRSDLSRFLGVVRELGDVRPSAEEEASAMISRRRR